VSLRGGAGGGLAGAKLAMSAISSTPTYGGAPLETVIENPELIGKRCETSFFNGPF
jgi:hypothetical protein